MTVAVIGPEIEKFAFSCCCSENLFSVIVLFLFFFSFPFVAPFSSQEKKTAQRLTLFRPHPKKRRPALCEFIVGGAEGGRAVAPLFGAPSSMKLWTWRVFISLCGLICLSEGSVPRCGLAPTLLSVRALDSSGGGGTEQSGT